MNILIEARQGKLFFHVKLDDGSEESGFAPEGCSLPHKPRLTPIEIVDVYLAVANGVQTVAT
ncbi:MULTISPECIES: hypothetical protein [unclassified Mesorhizobium]|uniref:hypothetical protein n=1 Tax=unclassified Mesorhizobium TaxID=325217 RepID=UPI00333BDE9F